MPKKHQKCEPEIFLLENVGHFYQLAYTLNHLAYH